MLRMARAEDERALLPIYTHEHVERFLTFDSVDAQRFSAIFGQLNKDGNFFVYEADGEWMCHSDAARVLAELERSGVLQFERLSTKACNARRTSAPPSKNTSMKS